MPSSSARSGRDYCRFDRRLDEHDNPKLSGVNPNPGRCRDDHLAKTANYASLTYPKMFGPILKSVKERLGLEQEQSARRVDKEPSPLDLTRSRPDPPNLLIEGIGQDRAN
ncbi:MAG: hypothetical protein WC093_01310 [Methanoculleus sp.]